MLSNTKSSPTAAELGRVAMSAWRGESPPPTPSARLIDVAELPTFLTDFELRRPPSGLADEMAVLVLCHEQGPPTVLKVARGLRGNADLRRQRRVLAELAIQQGLDDEWRELLPRILAFDERSNATVSVESHRPGMDLANVLSRRPDSVVELTAAALSAIAPLHRRTARRGVLDPARPLRRWIVESLTGLTDMCRRLDPPLVPEVNRLGEMAQRAVGDRRVPLSWTHGDYTPSNVRVAGAEGPVTGIVSWGAARPGRPALIDEYLMVLTASCQVERADLGTVVASRLRAGGLSDGERAALRAAPGGGATNIDDDDDRIDEPVAILLTWMHHAAEVWRKRAILPNHHIWWATNVAPVLHAVGAGEGPSC